MSEGWKRERSDYTVKNGVLRQTEHMKRINKKKYMNKLKREGRKMKYEVKGITEYIAEITVNMKEYMEQYQDRDVW